MYTVRTIPPDKWVEEAAHVPHDTFVELHDWTTTPPHPVHEIIAIELDGQPWLWQAISLGRGPLINVNDGHFWQEPLFQTYDERGERIPWGEVMDTLPEADEVVFGWYVEQLFRKPRY